jgi:short-subunit dehydrogenase
MTVPTRTKTVLITGCSDGGIGSALAAAFQRRGHIVFAAVRNREKASTLASLPNVTVLTLDVTDKHSIAQAVQVVCKQTNDKGLDVLVNNAGQGVSIPLVDADLDSGRKLFEVNFWAVLAMIQAFVPMLVKSKGTIVNISSLATIVHYPYIGLYDCSKAAVNAASDTLRVELQPLGVNVVTVMVGMVRTRFQDNLPPVVLPEDSFYKPVENSIRATTKVEEDMAKHQMPVDQFAKELVGDILAGKTGHIYKGGMSFTLRLFKWLMPTWILVGTSQIPWLMNYAFTNDD